MAEGYLGLFRSFFKGDLWNEKRVFSRAEAWLDLTQFAAFVPTVRCIKGKFIHHSIGEFVAAERFLENRWSWSRTKVRNFIKNHVNNHKLDQRKDQGLTVLKVCNYETYVFVNTTKDTKNNTKEDTTNQTQKEPRENQGSTKVKKDKKINKDKEIPPKAPQGARRVQIPRLYGRIIRCITPGSKLDKPRDKAEMRAWALASAIITEEDVEIVERFYKLKKSPKADLTWNRKTGVTALLNQWTSQVEYAKAMKFKRDLDYTGPPKPTKLNLTEPEDWKDRVPEEMAERGWDYLCQNDHDSARRLHGGEDLRPNENFDAGAFLRDSGVVSGCEI